MVARNMQYLLNTLRGHQVSLPAIPWAALALLSQEHHANLLVPRWKAC